MALWSFKFPYSDARLNKYRGVGRIFKGGSVKLRKFCLPHPLFKNHAHYSQTKRHNIQHYEGVSYIVAYKRIAR